MADNISSGTNVPDADFSNDLFSDTDFSNGIFSDTDLSNDIFSDAGFSNDIFSDAGFSNDLSSCQPHLEALQNLLDQDDEMSDQQNLREASPSKLDLEWGHIYGSTSGDRHGHYGGSSGMYSSSECWSVGSEAQSQTSVQRFLPGNTYYDQGKAKDGSTGKSVIRPGDKNVTRNIPPFSSNNYEADESPSMLENDDMQSESAINLKDETCEMNFQVPGLGMVFSSEEEAYKFYKDYATKMGFRVRKGKTQRLTDGTIRKRYLYCSAQGFRSENKSGRARKYQRKETRIGCDAMVQFTHDNDSGKWEITRIVLEHNHDTNSPNQRHKTCPSTNIKEDAGITTIWKAGMMKETGVANSPESFPFVNHSNSYLSNEKTNILPPEHSQSLVNFLDHLQLEDPTADQSQGQSSSFTYRLMHKALNVITKSVAVEESQKIVEKYLDMALKEVENVLKVEITRHLDGKDAEIHKKNGGSNGIACMETQWKVPNSPCSSQEESCDGAVIHCRPLKEARKDDQGSRARSGSPHCVGETSRKQRCMPTKNMLQAKPQSKTTARAASPQIRSTPDIDSQYLLKLQSEHQKLGPFTQVLPICSRLLTQEIFRVSVVMPNQGFDEFDRLRHRSPRPISSSNLMSNVGGRGLAGWNGLPQERIGGPPGMIMDWQGAPASPISYTVKRILRLDIPVDTYPNFNFVGRILGPRGNSLKRVEATTGCRVYIRGEGSIKDPNKEDKLRGRPGYEHLNEPFHVLIEADLPANIVDIRLRQAREIIEELLKPVTIYEEEDMINHVVMLQRSLLFYWISLVRCL
ncbi:hypothetical protein Pint_18476 [Pistacia integerrima]|uniref:Uncharacterized protein n=1 Tax=Pistacia integerrima TaxID=434235 RepID=A0ACC0Z1C7_9ROSI|nr:hypothetical protein Pint_18476 [Pistacia integerrima]